MTKRQNDSLPVLQPTRRDVIKKTVQGACAMTLVTATGCTFADVYGELGYREIRIDLETEEYKVLQSVGGVAAIDEGAWKIVVIRTGDDELTAMNRMCPHAQLEMSPSLGAFWGDGGLVCPHHGSIFDAEGKALEGSPTQTSVATYRVEFDMMANTAIIYVGEDELADGGASL